MIKFKPHKEIGLNIPTLHFNNALRSKNNNKHSCYLEFDMPVDPVCGIEMEKELAVSHKHKDKSYYFCCEGCKRIFIRKPNKYIK